MASFSWKRHSSAVAWKLDLLRSKSHGSCASCETATVCFCGAVRLLNYRIAILLSCTHGKLHPGSATPRRLPRSLTRCVPSLTAPAAYQVSRLVKLVHAKNIPPSLFWKSSNPATSSIRRESLARLRCLQDSFVTPGDPELHDPTAPRSKI